MKIRSKQVVLALTSTDSNSSHQCFIAGIPHVNSVGLYDNVILTTTAIATTPSGPEFPLLVRGGPRRRVIFIFTSAFVVLNAIARCLLLVTLNFPLISMCFTSTWSDTSSFIFRTNWTQYLLCESKSLEKKQRSFRNRKIKIMTNFY